MMPGHLVIRVESAVNSGLSVVETGDQQRGGQALEFRQTVTFCL